MRGDDTWSMARLASSSAARCAPPIWMTEGNDPQSAQSAQSVQSVQSMSSSADLDGSGQRSAISAISAISVERAERSHQRAMTRNQCRRSGGHQEAISRGHQYRSSVEAITMVFRRQSP